MNARLQAGCEAQPEPGICGVMLVIDVSGAVSGLYDESIGLGQLGALRVTRAGRIELDEQPAHASKASPRRKSKFHLDRERRGKGLAP
jgi:hypothetical protein